jgi:hypothetical protein
MQLNKSKLICELESAKQARKIADVKYAVTSGGCKSKIGLVRQSLAM